jgi:hypothetical protein
MHKTTNHTKNSKLKQAEKSRKRIGNSAGNKNAPAANRGAKKATNHAANGTSTSRAAQRARLLAWLRERGTLTTIQARELLNVMHPAGRVFELRENGHNIVTVWTWANDHEGRAHRVGRYALLQKGTR